MSVHVFFNVLNELRKSDEMKCSASLVFYHEEK